VLTFLKRKQLEPTAQVEPPQPATPVRRARQQNIKVSGDCAAAFAAIAAAQGFSKAALFEDMVADRLQQLERQGMKVSIG
jgi:hypothetical protein